MYVCLAQQADNSVLGFIMEKAGAAQAAQVS